jgi:cell wall assembly regulator SMI1
MGNDVREKSIEDLDLSVRCYGLLEGLGIETVGQLVDLPQIVIPLDWPAKIGRLVATELQQAIEELGIEYRGTIVAPSAKEAALRATGDVTARWKTIAAWLETQHPGARDHFNPPATAETIAKAEAELGATLPEDYKQFLALHDGQREFAPMVGLGALLPIEEVAEARRNIFGEETPVAPEGVAEGVRPVDYCNAWIPISRSARGRDYLCIDLDPAPGGARGQIIEYVVDDDARPLVAKSFADLLSLYFEQAQTGEIDLDEEID